MREKFKDKIERQNWNVKQQISLDGCPQEFTREASFHKVNRSLSDLDLYRTSRPQSNLSMTAQLKQSSNFNLGYQRGNNDTNRINRNSNFGQTDGFKNTNSRDELSQFK